MDSRLRGNDENESLFATNHESPLMKPIALTLSALLASASVTISTPALADLQLATAKNCMACHAIATKVVGPAYKDVAAKYAGQKDAVEKLTAKLMKGGSGVWGTIPMPANPQVTPEEAKKLAIWVLHQK